jgi:hypothetical protein
VVRFPTPGGFGELGEITSGVGVVGQPGDRVEPLVWCLCRNRAGVLGWKVIGNGQRCLAWEWGGGLGEWEWMVLQ